MARSNMRSGRGDRRGAARLALLAFLLMLAVAFLYAHYIPAAQAELRIFVVSTAWGLIVGATFWVLYVALEPHARKRWPSSLISWSRLLAGQMRDPVVGRDLLVGILAGIFWAAEERAMDMVPGWMGKIPDSPLSSGLGLDYDTLSGLRALIGGILLNIVLSVAFSLVVFFLFFLVRLVTRKEWLAVLVTISLFSIARVFGDYPVVHTISALVYFSIALPLLIRFGLLALVMAYCADNVLFSSPLTTHLSAWYAQPTFLAVFVILAAAIFGFYTSTAGKPLFGRISLDA
jgi:hypothetical protein